MAARLTAEEVAKVARLARLQLSPEESAQFNHQLGAILEYVTMLDELETSDVEPMAHAIEVSDVFRADQSDNSLTRDQALSNAPSTDGRYFRVPPILDDV